MCYPRQHCHFCRLMRGELEHTLQVGGDFNTQAHTRAHTFFNRVHVYYASSQDPEEGLFSLKSVSSTSTPAPLSHHPCSPSPLLPPPTSSSSHLLPEHKSHTIPPSSYSPSPTPRHPLSAQAKTLKQGFTLDEDQQSPDPLPKFLSSRWEKRFYIF